MNAALNSVLAGERMWAVVQGHCLTVLKSLPAECVHAVITSPPYWGLRDYKLETSVWGGDPSCSHEWGGPLLPANYNWAEHIKAKGGLDRGHQKAANASRSTACVHCGAWRGCLGLEPTLDMYVTHLVEIFRLVRNVLRHDGTLWLNMGDSYAGSGGPGTQVDTKASGKYKEAFLKFNNPNRHACFDSGKADTSSVSEVGRSEAMDHALCSSCGAWRGSLGLEPTPHLYTYHLVKIFREVRRVLHGSGTVWLNLGDSYAGSGGAHKGHHANPGISKSAQRDGVTHGFDFGRQGSTSAVSKRERGRARYSSSWNRDGVPHYGELGMPERYLAPRGLKPKDLCGIPWRAAFALQADGWWLRSDIIWAKPNGMPESVTDRPTRSHEYLFLLTKQRRYYYDAHAIREPQSGNAHSRGQGLTPKSAEPGIGIKANNSFHKATSLYTNIPGGRNKRSVWTVPTQPFRDAHFATFPPKLVEPCVLAGTSEKGACSVCGSQWVRVVHKRVPRIGHEIPEARRIDPYVRPSITSALRVSHSNKWNAWKQANPSKTLGWRPACTHKDSPITPIVLDPFCGSGVTGLVALSHGRRFIGIDLKPEYVEMAIKRISSAEAA